MTEDERVRSERKYLREKGRMEVEEGGEGGGRRSISSKVGEEGGK